MMLLVLVALTGCQSTLNHQAARQCDPALPMTLTCAELVDYLNSQNHGLVGWCCTSTSMHVRLPNGLSQRLTGNIACQAPQYFRLTAHNVIATADIGSNASRCWFYTRPGEPAVLTWKHEDTPLLTKLPEGVPYIDPNWLMLVLGVKPLDTSDYTLSRAPGSSQELWLTAIEDAPEGRSMRRVIKVDTVRGVIREHALYDSEANPLVRAELSQHRACQGHLIPHHVRLLFPQMDSEMVLKFDGPQTNPNLPDELWRLPDNNVQVVDLGEVIRHRMSVAGNSPNATRVRLQAPQFDPPVQSAMSPSTSSAFDGPATTDAAIEEPDWDQPISYSQPRNTPTAAPLQAQPVRRGFWPWTRRRSM
ncbi:MAG: hypothetical protein KDA81_04795 [Planctomycetaceae bacterium]|nr:hypothetical protein [Planctomycetaceae bacterium]